MSGNLSLDSVSLDTRDKVYSQDYSTKPQIHGVKIITLKTFVSEEGDFGEILRLSNSGEFEGLEGFSVAQINRTTLLPGSVKAWHLHFKQDEVWYVIPSGQVLVGLWDVRKDSRTHGEIMRIALGGGQSKLVFIPKGVAHGSLSLSNTQAELLYFVNQQFDIHNPDEKRIPWDSMGADFWKPQHD